MTGAALTRLLSETDHRHFLEHGYVLLRGLVPQSAIDEAVAALEASEVARASDPGATPLFHDQIPEVDEAVPLQAIHRAARELAGPDMALVEPQRLVYIPRRQQEGDQRLHRWHIDLVYPMLTPDAWAINTFVFLTRVRVGGGAFHFDPGSPRRVRAELLRDGMSTIRGDGKLRSEPVEPVEFLAEPGDVIIYSYLMGHTASINVSDPQTRHSFAAGIFQPVDRLVSKHLPVEEMSTLQRASSTRYHRSVDPSLPDYTPAPDAPRPPATGGRVRTHVSLRAGGRIRIFLVEEERPNLVRHVSSIDWSHWEESAPIELEPSASITRLDWEHQPDPGLLVSVEDGGRREVRRLLGEPIAESRFRVLEPIAGAAAAEITYSHPAYGAREAQGRIELRIPANEPTRLEWTCTLEVSQDRSHLDGVGFVVPHGRRIRDFTAKPNLPAHHLILELEDADGKVEVCWAASPHLDDFTAAQLQPLDTGGLQVRNLRLHERARDYWLVSWIDGESGTIRWGAIDWAEAPRLRPLDSRHALCEALGIVELI